MTSIHAELPLFPLRTVLFPDGLLPLRIFEARYMDMTRECLRDQSSFGICLLRSGDEVARKGEVPETESVGCMAEIIDCDMEQMGVLLVNVRGTRRFRLLSTHVQPDGLLRGMAEPIPADDPPDGSEHIAKMAACAEALERVIGSLSERDATSVPFLKPYRLDDPVWVGNRLSEVLPIPLGARQKLMALEDAAARIDLVHQYMQRHQLL
ncbi:MAG: LON peptidase substrate-binding domain-containing protein [Janthinobacterium lividum]